MRSPENQISDWGHDRMLDIEDELEIVSTNSYYSSRNRPIIPLEFYSYSQRDGLKYYPLDNSSANLDIERMGFGSPEGFHGMSWTQRLRPLGMAARVF